MLAVGGVGVAVGPREVLDAPAFELDEVEVAPAGEIDGDIVVADAAGAAVARTKHLHVQEFAIPVTVDPQAERGLAADVERGRKRFQKFRPRPGARVSCARRGEFGRSRACRRVFRSRCQGRRNVFCRRARGERFRRLKVLDDNGLWRIVRRGGHQRLDAQAHRLGGEWVGHGPSVAPRFHALDLVLDVARGAQAPCVIGAGLELEFRARFAQLRENGFRKTAFVAQSLVIAEDGHEPLIGRHVSNVVRVHAHEGNAHVMPERLAHEIFDIVRERRFGIYRGRAVLPCFDGPPAEVHGQVTQRAALVRRAMYVDKAFVRARRVVPRAHARAYAPEMVVERAHLEERGLVEPVRDLVDEFRSVMPGPLPAPENVFAVKRIQIHHVESALIERVRRVCGNLSEQRRISVRREKAKTLFELVHVSAGLMGCGRCSVRSSRTTGERERRFLGCAAESNQLIVDLKRYAIAQEKARSRGHVRRGLCDGHRVSFRPERRGQRERGVLAETGVRHGRHVRCILCNEEGIGVQSGRDAGLVQTVQHGLHACAAAREQFRVRLAIAKAQRRTRVKIDLVQSEVLDQFDPLVHGLFRKVAEIEEIRATVDGCIQCPGTADGRIGGVLVMRQLRRRGDRLLKHIAQFRGWRGDDGRLCPGNAEALAGHCAQTLGGAGDFQDIRLQVQRERTRRKGVLEFRRERKRHIEQRQFVDAVVGDTVNTEDEIAGESRNVERHLQVRLSITHTQKVAFQGCVCCVDALFAFLHAREGGCAFRGEIIGPGSPVDEVQVSGVGADFPTEGVRLDEHVFGGVCAGKRHKYRDRSQDKPR